MTRSTLRIVTCLSMLGLFNETLSLRAEEFTASHVMPDSTIAFVAIEQPTAVIATLFDHPLITRIQNTEGYEKATSTDDYRNFLTGIKFFETQIGSPWRPAIEALTAKGVYAGFDKTTEGAVLLVHGKDEATMENFRVKILELTRLNGGESAKPKNYRDLVTYRVGDGGAVVLRDWLVVSNKGELGKVVLDRLLDTNAASSADAIAGTLSANTAFGTASKDRDANSDVWAFVDVETIRDAGVAAKALEGKAENPLVELLFGGIQSMLRQTPYATASLVLSPSQVSAKISTPSQADWIPAERNYYFGTNFSGVAPTIPAIPETMLTIGAYRDISQMWLHGSDLFDERVNDELAKAESGLSTIFAGRDFAEDILGSLDPQIAAIVTRQSFADVKPTPALKLPAFALLMKLRDPETMRPELRRTFQSAVGFFNIVGAQNGQPQLEMDMRKETGFDLVTSRYLAEKKDQDSDTASIHFNFSPSVSFAGDQFVLASTETLATQLAQATIAKSDATVNTSVVLNATVAKDVLTDNREQLISQNMLEEGNTRDEAAAAIALFLELVQCFKGAELSLDAQGDSLDLNVTLDIDE